MMTQGGGRLDPTKAAGVEKTLRDDYQQQSKDYSTAADFYQRAAQGYKAGQSGNPQGDMTLLFSFMKVLDPTSVVRESEYATAASFRGVPEGLVQLYNKTLSGESLTPQQRNNIMQQMEGLFQDKGTQQLNNEKNYQALANRNKVDPQNVMIGVPMVREISPSFIARGEQGQTPVVGAAGAVGNMAPQASPQLQNLKAKYGLE